MKWIVALGLACSSVAVAAAPDQPALAQSTQPHSNVSLLLQPQLDDGRLVLKLAVHNRTTAAVPFGPGSVTVSKASGEAISLTSLQQLENDVKLAAGMSTGSQGTAPTAGAYALRQQPTASDGSGRMDVTGYTGGAAVAPQQQVQWSKHSPDTAAARTKIAALEQAILQDGVIAPAQVVAGEIVTQKLKFSKREDRTIRVRVHVAGDEHDFTLLAPES